MSEFEVIWFFVTTAIVVISLISLAETRQDVKKLWRSRDTLYKRLDIEIAQRVADKKDFNKKLVKLEHRLRKNRSKSESINSL